MSVQIINTNSYDTTCISSFNCDDVVVVVVVVAVVVVVVVTACRNTRLKKLLPSTCTFFLGVALSTV